MEIERKFLLVGEPPGLFQAPSHHIRQGYLVTTPQREVRLRRRDDDCFLTVKDGSGLERSETEVSLAQAQFDLLWPLTSGRRVEKIRYLLPWEGLTVEVDIYEGDLAPLRVAEVEFGSREQSERFVKPPFFGAEVTGRREYSNAWLARG
ncbi:MAG TPA: adenylate cyclase [Chthoniobacteraceae bacterium]|nr:adenylate cyclase [Chthoniobacteraceae bacterium]